MLTSKNLLSADTKIMKRMIKNKAEESMRTAMEGCSVGEHLTEHVHPGGNSFVFSGSLTGSIERSDISCQLCYRHIIFYTD